jgi:hypothetical protein
MNALIKCLAVVSLVGAGFVAHDFTQDEKAKGGQDAGMPQPTEEHKWLAAGAGKWKATGKYMMGPENWVPINGVQTNTMQTGGFWQVIEFKDDTGQFAGNGLVGYDPLKKKFVSVWVDSMTTELPLSEGTLSADKKTMSMEFMRTDQKSGKKIKVTETVTRKDDKTTVLEMFDHESGSPVKVLEINYAKM